MRNSLTSVYYGFRTMVRRWSDELVLVGLVLLLTVCVGFGYKTYSNYVASELPNETRYVQYEEIIKQITNGEFRDMKIPANTSISIGSNDIIVVTNNLSKCSVTGTLSESATTFKRDSGNFELLTEKVMVGGVVFGLLKLLSKIFGLCINLVNSFIEGYKDKRIDAKLAKKEKIKKLS